MKVDTRTLQIQKKILEALDSLVIKRIGVVTFREMLFEAENTLKGYADNSFPYEKELIRILANLGDALSSEIYMYRYDQGYDDDENRLSIPMEISEEIQKMYESDIQNLKKLIVRGSEEGNLITDNELKEWWTALKEREREEFYSNNGCYE